MTVSSILLPRFMHEVNPLHEICLQTLRMQKLNNFFSVTQM